MADFISHSSELHLLLPSFFGSFWWGISLFSPGWPGMRGTAFLLCTACWFARCRLFSVCRGLSAQHWKYFGMGSTAWLCGIAFTELKFLTWCLPPRQHFLMNCWRLWGVDERTPRWVTRSTNFRRGVDSSRRLVGCFYSSERTCALSLFGFEIVVLRNSGSARCPQTLTY